MTLIGFGYTLYNFDVDFYHACTTKEAAERLIYNMSKQQTSIAYLISSRLQVIDGYIPEGIRYAIDLNGESICARKMILNI